MAKLKTKLRAALNAPVTASREPAKVLPFVRPAGVERYDPRRGTAVATVMEIPGRRAVSPQGRRSAVRLVVGMGRRTNAAQSGAERSTSELQPI